MITVAWAAYGGLLLARIAAWVVATPLVAGRAPMSVRGGLAVTLAAFYLVGQPPPWDARWAAAAETISSGLYLLALFREVLIGLVLGVLFGLWLLPARVAGEFLTFQIGLNAAPLPGPTGEEGAGSVTSLMEILATLVFFSLDGHHILLTVLHTSWAVLPLAGATLPPLTPAINGMATAYELGLLLAAPVAACLLLLSVTLAVMARTAPQLNIYSIGFTLQVMVLMLAGGLLLPEMVHSMQFHGQQLSAWLLQTFGRR
ncbi:MAG: flagellar biosynthetic protein FliR [Gemmataceae bacterium]|nr:flagellar biosynthetic protein FliR [Gemmataceae bacterium]